MSVRGSSPSLSSTAQRLVGKKLDKYEVIQELGAGGMGAVFEAKNSLTGRRVAIKVILGELSADQALVARFQREARAAGSIESRHIAQVLDAGTDAESGAPYLVMELLSGYDLDALMKRMGTLRPTLALRIVAQALAGLEKAHSANVIHRDIKPANLYIAESDGGQRVVKLVDFGIAKVKDDVTASREFSLTQTASILGSPLYMSPEQARTSKTVDGRADLWSLGVVLYQMVTGRAPHASAGSLTELLLAICSDPAEPVQNRAPWVSPEVARIIMRSIEIDPSKRFQRARDLLDEIQAIVPDWQHLDASLITPMTDAERALVAPRLESPAELHVSTGPNSARPAVVDAATVAPSKRNIALTPVDSAKGASGWDKTATDDDPKVAGASSALAKSTPGVSAISAPGALPSTGGLASTNEGTTTNPLDAGAARQKKKKSALLPIAIGIIAVVGVGGAALGLSMRQPASTTALPRAEPTSTPTISASAQPATTTSAQEIATTTATASVPAATAASSSKTVIRPLPSAKASATTTATATAPSKPTATAPTTTATASSPISRDFN